MAVRKKAPSPLDMNGFIGPGMEVHGTVRFKNLLRVDGVLEGRVESFERLVVGATGRVTAEVIVGSLEVHGRVSGKISVDDQVEILPGARVEGELYASEPALHISKGGVFDGELFMTTPADDASVGGQVTSADRATPAGPGADKPTRTGSAAKPPSGRQGP